MEPMVSGSAHTCTSIVGSESLHPSIDHRARESSRYAVTSGTSSAPDRRRALPVHVVRGLCDTVLRRAESRPFGPYAKRLLGCLAHCARTAMAAARPRCRRVACRILVPDLFGPCHRGRVLDGR